MGFWKKLFGLEGKKKAELNIFATDKDGDGKVQDGTIWERPADLSVNLDETLAKAEKLLAEVAPKKSAPKKKTTSTAKKAPAKKPATTKKPAAKTAATKKPATKKPATKKK